MQVSMTVPAHSLQIIEAQSNCRISNVVWCQLNLVMDNLARLDDSFAQTDLTQSLPILPVSISGLLPCLALIESFRKRFHPSDPPVTVVTFATPVLMHNFPVVSKAKAQGSLPALLGSLYDSTPPI